VIFEFGFKAVLLAKIK